MDQRITAQWYSGIGETERKRILLPFPNCMRYGTAVAWQHLTAQAKQAVENERLEAVKMGALEEFRLCLSGAVEYSRQVEAFNGLIEVLAPGTSGQLILEMLCRAYRIKP